MAGGAECRGGDRGQEEAIERGEPLGNARRLGEVAQAVVDGSLLIA